MKNKIALFDMDGTLADYSGQLLKDLNKIKSDYEPEITDVFIQEGYLEQRRHMITSQYGWFKKLPVFQLGFDILNCCKKIGYDIAILTKGPSTKYSAWNEKVEWCHKHIGKHELKGITITHNKGLVYGNVLVDDFPEYIENWLEHRHRGIVIMPAQSYNKKYERENVYRYDGTNLKNIQEILKKHFEK